MPLFFVLAGFFAALLVGKRGLKGTYVNRAKRVLGPLAVSIVTILPITVLSMGAFIVSARFETHQLIPEWAQVEIIGREMADAGFPVNEPSVAHLWFLYYLLYFYLTIPLCRAIVALSTKIEGGVSRFITSPFAAVALGLYAALTLWPFSGGVVFEGFLFLKPHVPSLIYYGSFFIFGYVFHHYRPILKTFDRYLAWFVPLSLILFAASILATRLEFAQAQVTPGVHAIAVLTNGLCTWAMIYMLMGVFLRFFDFQSPWILYLSNASYWVYLIHLPIIAFAAWLVLPYDVHAFIKFPFVVAFTTVMCFLSFHYLVQKTWVSLLLNGMKFDAKWPWAERVSY
jgi:peptidoglycan/LPS O-acetylase OafA/YrhL